MRFTGLLLISLILGVPIPRAAGQVGADQIELLARHFIAKEPASGIPTGLAYQTALDVQSRFVKLLEPKLGQAAGYKVGLVTPAGQRRFGIDHPVRGVLLRKMLLPNYSAVHVNYGVRPILEADLIVRVKDEGINGAKTIEEAARHLSEIVAFIELADNLFATNAPMDAGVLVAGNVGARLGILGETHPISDSPEFIEQFGKMVLVLKDRSGKELSRDSAAGILGHPLRAVLWLVEDLRASGGRLKAGDYLSLGSPSPQVTPRSGETYTLTYEGLPAGPKWVVVRFE